MEFVVLPDHPVADEVFSRLPPEYRKNTLHHHSGRPWLVGRWSADDVICVQSGSSMLVLLGSAQATEPALSAQLGKVRDLRDLDRVAQRTAGCFHLVATVGGVVRAQGSLSTARQLFHTSIAGVTVAANRISALAELRRLTLAEEHVAMSLLAYAPPWPLNERSVWREIDSVPFAHYLRLSPDGTAEATRWWNPPEPDLPIAVAANGFREALVTAVTARSGMSSVLGADLSGGMDSTSLCFVAAEQDLRLVTIRRQSMDPANPEDAIAGRAMAALPSAEHIVLDRDTASLFYDSPDRNDLEIDGPPPFIAAMSHMVDVARIMASHGVTRHMQGHGSDELAATGATYVNAIAQHNLIGSLGSIRAIRAMRRWSIGTTLRAVRPFPEYAVWLRRCADNVVARPNFGSQLGWEPVPQLPPWITQEGADLVRETMRTTAASHPQPLAPIPAQHEMLRSVVLNGAITRCASTLGARFDVSFEAPFLDDRVVEAALAVRLADRYVVGRTKPVMVAALRRTVPDFVLDRTTKGHFTMDTYVGRKRNLAKMREMCEESRLAAMGLIDRGRFRQVLSAIMPDPANINPLESTLACEAWLRSLPSEVSPRLG